MVLNFADTYAAQDHCEQIIITIQNYIILVQKKKLDLKNAQEKVRQQLQKGKTLEDQLRECK